MSSTSRLRSAASAGCAEEAGAPAAPAAADTAAVRNAGLHLALTAQALAHELHPDLRRQIEQLVAQSEGAVLEPSALLAAVSRRYERFDEERRGIVRSMQLMADEVCSLPIEARAAGHPQVILDHIKDVVLTVDARGAVRGCNSAGVRVFGCAEAELLGCSLTDLLPRLGQGASVAQSLLRLASHGAGGSAQPSTCDMPAQRRSGELFPAEVAVSRARLGSREVFVVCLREATERRLAEQALRDSEARFRTLVDHAPEGIVVYDVDADRFVDANENAMKLFGMSREALLASAPRHVSPPLQADGLPSSGVVRGFIDRTLAGEPLCFEWTHRDTRGRDFPCEVRMVRLPSATRRLIRGSITDISERKRSELITAGEREVFAQLASNAPLPAALASITQLIESVCRGHLCSIGVLAPDGARFQYVVAPQLPQRLRAALDHAPIDIGSGSCAAAVCLDRQVLVADAAKDPFWQLQREAVLAAGLKATWSAPIRSSLGSVLGSLCVYSRRAALPGASELELIGHAAQLASIAIERRLAEQAIFAEKERAQVTLQSIGDGVVTTDASGRIDYLNPVAERLTGWSGEEARGRPVAQVLRLLDELTRQPLEDLLECSLRDGVGATAADQSVLVDRAGQEIAIQASASPIRDRQGQVAGSVVVFHDVTRERRLRRALSYQASHDALTGLINRREFDSRLQAAADAARRGEGQYALLYVDLDQFKLVNDTCGHSAGDRLIREITALLHARVRSSDTIARLGGDEFGILLAHCTLEHAETVAEAVRRAIRELRFVWGSSQLSVGASIGLVVIDHDTESAVAAMSAADIACYAAKEQGRNRVHVYDSGTGSGRHREMQWVARVTRAAEDGRFELLHQPIVAIAARSAAPTFHEITVCMRDEQGSIVQPGEFIPAAERYGVMAVIDRWVVEHAVRFLGRWSDSPASRPLLAVNLSGTSLNDETFLDFLLGQLAEADLGRSLCFEITETAAVANLATAVYFIRELKARGCRFALDDFGSGLSSFMYLKTLPVDFLKIDGQFVANVATDPVDRSMVEAICQVGRALGISTIAERVESGAVLEELERIGLDFVQGFHLARPRPLAELVYTSGESCLAPCQPVARKP